MKKFLLINKDFSLLWMGQLVSSLGDRFHEIALGFWVLAMTGSTAMMGTLMAAVTIPKVILGPIAGVISDRSNRRWLIVAMDFIRGIFVIGIAILAYQNLLQIWMVLIAGIIVGICSSFFDPTMMSAIPDIVPKEKLMPANSYFSMIRSSTGILGNSAGGFLFQILGAPLMFLIDGISYIISSLSEIFINIPVIKREHKVTFSKDLKEGGRYVWNNKGIRLAFILFSLINFFALAGYILFLPLFERFEHLGAGKYGIAMGLFTAGSLVGTIIVSRLNLSPNQKLTLFAVVAIGMSLSMLLLPLSLIFWIILLLMFLSGFFNSILNVIVNTNMQLNTPAEHRGKIFGLLSTISGALAPLGMATGGIVAEVIGIRTTIFCAFAIMLVTMIILLFFASFREFIRG